MFLQRHECLYLLESINTKNRLAFLAPCLGKTAHDNEEYVMAHTELLLIYFADFQLLPDGSMAIVNLDKNPAYQKFYAEGKFNVAHIHNEFYHWAKCMGLEIEPGRNFHNDNAILFTASSSLKLKSLDLHWNANYCKTLFSLYLTWARYTRMTLANDNDFGKLPEEIQDHIFLMTNPSFSRIYRDQSFFHAIQTGKARGKEEHAQVLCRTQALEQQAFFEN